MNHIERFKRLIYLGEDYLDEIWEKGEGDCDQLVRGFETLSRWEIEDIRAINPKYFNKLVDGIIDYKAAVE